MNNKIRLSIIVLLLFLASCSVKTIKNHYILSYLPDPAKAEKFISTHIPFDKKVEVQNFEMNRIYDRNPIVVRESLHKLKFDSKNEWALRPDKSIPELLVYHINSLNLFKECKTDFFTTSPDYYISGVEWVELSQRHGVLIRAGSVVEDLMLKCDYGAYWTLRCCYKDNNDQELCENDGCHYCSDGKCRNSISL